MRALFSLLRPAAQGCLCLLFLFGFACGRSGRDSLPSSLSRFPQQLANPALEPSGVFADGWVAETAAVNLAAPSGEQVLAVRGTVPKIDRDDFRTELRLLIDGRELARRPLGIGDFSIEVPVAAPGGPGKHRVGLAFLASQQLPGGDGRSVGARLTFLGFERPSKPRAAGDVVAPGSGIRLGSGWDVVETFHNETFRWVANDAQVFIGPGVGRLQVTVEPGPGVDGKAFVLKLNDASGRQVDAVEVRRRETVNLFVPLEGGQEREFRLHVEGGGKSAPNDPRTLNFRLFRME